MISRILNRSLLVVTTVIALGLASWGQCSNANVTGKYGFSGGGLDNHGAPIAFMAYIKANGKGKFTGTETGSDNGTVFTNVPATGTYTINSDCTGSGTIKLKGNNQLIHYNLLVVSGGKSLQVLNTDAPNVQLTTNQAQGKVTCTAAGIQGKFGVEASGVFLGLGAVAFDGFFTLDGKGNVGGTESGSIAGQIFTGLSISGTYTVAPNCTGTMTFTVGTLTEHSSFVMINSGKELLVVETDPNTVVGGFGQQ